MTWLNITEEQQLYDSLEIDIVRTYNESPNGYTKGGGALSTFTQIPSNQKKLNMVAPEANIGTADNYWNFIKFTSPIARNTGKSEIKTICGDGSWLIINESATSDVPLIDLTSFNFAQYFYYITISFAYLQNANFDNGGSIAASPLCLAICNGSRSLISNLRGNDFTIGMRKVNDVAQVQGVCNFINNKTGFSNPGSLDAESDMTFSFNLEYVLNNGDVGTPNVAFFPHAKYLGFFFSTVNIPISVSYSYTWVIDKVQFEIKRIKK